MPAVPCANHPKELTVVRCGRCEKPICTRCMVDSPVGKKCRECARPGHHLAKTAPQQVLLALLVACAVALPAAVVMHQVPLLFLPAAIYGYVVAEVALWAGKRGRGLAMQAATGVAAAFGAIVTAGLVMRSGVDPETGRAMERGIQYVWHFGLFDLLNVAIGVTSAVSRVRFW